MAGFCWTPSARSRKQDSVSDALGVLLLRESVVETRESCSIRPLAGTVSWEIGRFELDETGCTIDLTRLRACYSSMRAVEEEGWRDRLASERSQLSLGHVFRHLRHRFVVRCGSRVFAFRAYDARKIRTIDSTTLVALRYRRELASDDFSVISCDSCVGCLPLFSESLTEATTCHEESDRFALAVESCCFPNENIKKHRPFALFEID